MNKLKYYGLLALNLAIALLVLNLILGALAYFFAPLAILKSLVNSPFTFIADKLGLAQG
jgi:hypothetical protein